MARAVFLGSDRFSLPVLSALLTRGPELPEPVEVVGVVTRPDRPAGRGRRLQASPVRGMAEDYGIPVLTPERVRPAVDAILAFQPDLLVVASYGQILPRRLIEVPPFRALNLHPSLLPRHRGPTPIEGVILAGDEETGTTLMVMEARMDAGPILAQRVTKVGPEETAGELVGRLAALSADLLIEELPAWLRGELVSRGQEEALATYTPLLAKSAGAIDWTESASEIARRVRAYNPWPVAQTTWEGRPLRILGARAVEGSAEPGVVRRVPEGVAVGTGEGLLLLEVVQVAGGRPIPVSALLAGHSSFVGAPLGG